MILWSVHNIISFELHPTQMNYTHSSVYEASSRRIYAFCLDKNYGVPNVKLFITTILITYLQTRSE